MASAGEEGDNPHGVSERNQVEDDESKVELDDGNDTPYADHPVSCTRIAGGSSIGYISSAHQQQNQSPQWDDEDSKLPPQVNEKGPAGPDRSGAGASSPLSRPGAHAIMSPSLPPAGSGNSVSSPRAKYEMMRMMASGNNNNNSTATASTATSETSAAAATVIATTRPGAHSETPPSSARVKYDLMHPSSNTATMPPPPPVFVPSDAETAHAKDDTAHGTTSRPSHNVLAAAAVAAATGAAFGPNFKDQMRHADPAQNRNTTTNAIVESVPTGTHNTASGPGFKDQARSLRNPLEERVIVEEDPELQHVDDDTDADLHEPDADAGLSTTTDSGVNASPQTRRQTPHLVQAELVVPEKRSTAPIDVAVELYEEKPRRRVWIVVAVATLAIVVVVLVVALTQDRNGTVVNNASPPTGAPLMSPTGCDNATMVELGGPAVAVLLEANSTPVLVDYPQLQTCGSAPRLTGDRAGLWFTFETNATSGVRISTCTETIDLNGDFDSHMLLFSGSCDRLDCLEGNDNEQGSAQNCGTEAGVSFQAFSSTLYYILVYGKVLDAEASFAVQATSVRVRPTNNECVGATTLQNDNWLNSTVLDADPPSYECCLEFCNFENPAVWFLFESNEGEITISTCSKANAFGHNIFIFSGTCSTSECLYETQIASNVDASIDCDGTVNSVRFYSKVQSTYRIMVQGVADTSSAQTPNPVFNVTDPVQGDGHEDFRILARSSKFEWALNDVCEMATPLLPGSILQGSTSSATASENLAQACGAIVDTGAPDLWYVVQSSASNQTVLKVTGCTGNIELDTSNFNQQIIVYAGNDCGNLTCVAADGGFYYKDGVCHNKATVSWVALEKAKYYIRVLGFSTESSVSPFGILVESTGPPVNDNCDGAIALETGAIVPSTTIGASAATDALCNIFNSVSNTAAGVWFNVIGNGTRYTATTCTAAEVLQYDVDIDSQINVYSGDGCNTLSCFAVNENNNVNRTCNDGVSWVAENGVPYWIRVFSSSREGSFPFAVYPTPHNQVCKAAIMLEAGQSAVEGTTQGALVGPQDVFCGTVVPRDDVPAVWYSVTGADDDLTVFICTGNSTEPSLFDNQILVYNGSCGNLTCIDGIDDSQLLSNCSATDAAVTWFAEAGTVYYIKVIGYATVGTFQIEIIFGKPPTIPGLLYPTFPPIPPPANDLCENAKALSNELTVGSTITATPSASLSNQLGFCGSESLTDYRLSPDVWFQMNGTGEWLTVTTCTGLTSLDYNGFDGFLAIYSGTCSNLTCVTSNDDFYGSPCSPTTAIASWLAEESETYLIRLSGATEFIGGDYGIRIVDGKTEPLLKPVNDNCENSTLLELDQILNGTTDGAGGTNALDECGASTAPYKQSIADVWYSVIGTGETLTVSTCTGTSLDDFYLDTMLVVYAGNCTMGLTCIAVNNDDDRDTCAGPQSGVSWQSEMDVTYFVRVYLSYPTAGTFGLWAYVGTPDGQLPPDYSSTIPPSAVGPAIAIGGG